MEYRLHHAATNREGITALARMDYEVAASKDQDFIISFAEENRFDSSYRCDSTFAAALAVILARLEDKQRRFEFGIVPKIVHQLFGQNWFSRFKKISLEPDGVPVTRLPFERFETSEIDRYCSYLEDYLEGKGLPPLDSMFCQSLQMCLLEVFANAETHSNSALGVFVCGQHYPALQHLVLTIADAGVTIPERIVSRFGRHLSPVHALEWAMKKGNTTKTNTPGGIGLKLLRDFAREQHGEVWIASGRAFWEMQSGVESITELDDPFPGTVVTLKIPTEPTLGALPPELSKFSPPPTSHHE